ncbi:MAG: enoyl-CoA hydratase/isomerase family protein [Alphaproteobacteria bacterium]|nr:enoyl-CoA hydratase/isomerase family protein [Alphaproteobacteria bacterium]
MQNDAVEREERGALTILRLCRPEKMNALTEQLKHELGQHVPAFFQNPDARCLVITGSGGAFCAGGDLATLRDGQSPAETRARMERSHLWAKYLLSGTKPVITAVNGAAAGAGFGLALMGDIILASEDAYFLPGFSAVGVAADLALTMTLSRAVGTPRAKDILLSNRKIKAREALEMGMISRMLPSESLMSEAIALGEKLAAGPTLALGLTKDLVNQSFDLPLDAYLAREIAAQVETFASADCIEGVDAFFSKRPPQFQGR